MPPNRAAVGQALPPANPSRPKSWQAEASAPLLAILLFAAATASAQPKAAAVVATDGSGDFTFGDALAFFDHCEIHALAHSVIMITAQSRHYAEEKSGYVFDHCRITAAQDADRVYLGRPWRAYATVVFLDTAMPAQIEPEGWHEWEHDGKPSLPTSCYAEYRSQGPGARPGARKQITAAEAALFALKTFLAGDDHWDPTQIH